MALQLLRSSLSKETRRSRALTALLALPNARHLEFRALDSNDLPNLVRMQNLKAAIGYVVGVLVVPQCTNCAAGYGQFPAGEGARCSLRAPLVSSAALVFSAPMFAPVTGSPTGRTRLRARRAAVLAVSCAVEAQMDSALRAPPPRRGFEGNPSLFLEEEDEDEDEDEEGGEGEGA
ncbi:hypothetical protein VF21_09870 [Pseudogymnoascus sp. 05NY08]|nr:hypothetical protein VF21_09870 [Pseudogymnoascus sp. 05NY08]